MPSKFAEYNVPGPRELLTVRKGHELWNLDLSQAELRVAASYAQCGRMLKMLAAGIDLHGETAKQIMKAKESDANWKERRQVAKNLNFAAIYGVGGYKFSRMLANQADIHYSVEECDRLVRAWHNLYPDVRPAYIRANHLFETRGWVKLLLGTEYERKSYCDREPTSGFNRMVQGSIALFVRLWLIEIERDWPGMLILTVHDSVLLEIPKTKKPKKVAEEIAAMGREFASNLFRTDMPVDIERYK